jgi:hypothetical protein
MKNSWQLNELNCLLDRKLPDYEALYLSNPKYQHEIDDIIVNTVWPSVKKCTQKSAVIASLAKNEEDPLANIKEEWFPKITRTLTFLLTDPERPIGCSSIRWFCRGTIQCSAIDYMISFEFYLYLPVCFDMDKILFLLKNENFVGMPPELSYARNIEDDGELVLKFTKGRGVGGGLLTYGPIAAEQVFNDVQDNLDLIYTVNDLEIDFNRKDSFDRLYQALVHAYQSI